MTSKRQDDLPALLSLLAQSARVYLHRINWLAERAYLVEADREFFRRANFLDERALSPEVKGRWVPLDALRRSVLADQPVPPGVCHFIFHVGHCGSTLISRLLDELPNVLVLREPAPLRALADAYPRADTPEALVGPDQVATDLELVYRLLARGFSPEDTPIVKATSICACLGPLLLSYNERSKALLLGMGLEPYLANVLSHGGHVTAARGLAPIRLRALLLHVAAHDLRLYRLSIGQLIALGWLAEAVDLNALQSRFGAARAMRLDFDAFLNEPALYLARICAHFGLPGDEATVRQVLDSQAFSSYAKRPDQPFTPQDRLERLDASRQRNGAEIAAGLALASDLAARFEPIAEAIEAFDAGMAAADVQAAGAD